MRLSILALFTEITDEDIFFENMVDNLPDCPYNVPKGIRRLTSYVFGKQSEGKEGNGETGAFGAVCSG